MKKIISYIKNIDANIVSGQDKDKNWFCKELPCKTVKETKKKIMALNEIYNEVNEQNEAKEEKTIKLRKGKDKKDKPVETN